MLWSRTEENIRAAVSDDHKFIAEDGDFSLVVICSAVLGREVSPSAKLTVGAKGSKSCRWDVLAQQGIIHLQPVPLKVGIGPLPLTKRVVLPPLSVLTFLEEHDVNHIPEELQGLRRVCARWVPARGEAAVMTWQDFESLVVVWSGVRLELLGGLQSAGVPSEGSGGCRFATTLGPRRFTAHLLRRSRT